jgi:phage terminase large subunit GpA-like protein
MNKLAEIWTSLYDEIHEDVYSFSVVKPKPSDWVESTIFLTKDVSRFSGFFKYDVSPYTREVIDHLDPGSPTRAVAIMKCAQSGFTQGVIIPGIAYIIAVNPDSMLFMAGDKELARNSIRTRLDPVIQSSGLSELIRPNIVRKKNQRTGDTDFSKEYAGGNLIVEGTQNADKMRQFSVKTVFADDWEAAPRNDAKEGSTRKLIEGRQTSFGNLAKTFFVSTPAIQQTSNIEPVYLLGDQRKWNWECPSCKTYVPIEWRVEVGENDYAGMKWELNERGKLIKESVHYECQNCRSKIFERDKYDLNLRGKWIATAEPEIEFYVSYLLNALTIPPGFINWVDLVREFLEACPPRGKVDTNKLKTFLNIRMGQTWEELGESPKVHQLMQNTREYLPGIVPDVTCESDGNKAIVMLTLACDLNGVMEQGNEDVRLDWELIAHAATGVTYSVNQGSIGSFKRKRDKSKIERERDMDRTRWTYMHAVPNSVWPEFLKLIEKNWVCESGNEMNAVLTVIDTGFFTRLAKDFIDSFAKRTELVIGVKGSTELDYRRTNKDTPRVRRSREQHNIYILEVNQIKDELSSFMKLRTGNDDYQPDGFMNFPQAEKGKYSMKNYFLHYEGEKRSEVVKDDKVVGFKWDKKSSDAQNHFWDVRIYGLAAKEIYIDLLKRSDPKLKNLTWGEFALMMSN